MKPFRWTIAKREQLGTLVEAMPSIDLNERDLLSGIRDASAGIIAFANEADLAFIGRTPENFFDYLSGIFSVADDAPLLHLIHFSLRGGAGSVDPKKLRGFFDYLKAEGVDAMSISKRSKPLAFVDYIASGGTMQSVVELLQLQAERDGVDWNAVQRRIRIIGLRRRTHNSPNTWRWQQNQDWLHLIPDAVIKNVSVPLHLIYYMANDQPKVTRSFHWGHWDSDGTGDRYITKARKQALKLAVQLYDTGRQREERLLLAGLIAKSRGMRQPATRRLVSRIKGHLLKNHPRVR